MVQVDVFWSYGLSAGLALAAHEHINSETSFWKSPYFTLSLLWTSLIFAPSGLYLLWVNPGWETMFVAKTHSSLPAWLVMLFALTNVTQGILGYFVTWRFLRKGKKGIALFQTVWSHLAMLFILIFGWDGTGYKRFFYAGTGEEWHLGTDYPISAFFFSEIFWTLIGMGLIFIPSYFGLIKKFSSQRGLS